MFRRLLYGMGVYCSGPRHVLFVAGLFMLLFALRILLRQYALLAFVLFVFSPTAVNYSRELKQYSAEAAATTAILLACAVYIEKASARRFWLLVATVTVGLLVGYAVAFLMPGIALMIWLYDRFGAVQHLTPRSTPLPVLERAFLFAIISGGILSWRVLFVCGAEFAGGSTCGMGEEEDAGVDSIARLTESDSYALISELPLNQKLLRKHKTIVCLFWLD